MGKAVSGYTTNAGWLIPVTVQLIPAVILIIGVPFTVGKSGVSSECFTLTNIGNQNPLDGSSYMANKIKL